MARASAAVRVPQPINSLIQTVKEYKYYRDEIKKLEALKKPIHETLIEALDTDGVEDDQGNLFLELDAEFEGVRVVQKTRRTSHVLNEDAAYEILKPLGLWEKCTETIRVVNQDAIMQALYEGELTEADIDCIYEPKITWALNLK
jgi:hypothetical protein